MYELVRTIAGIRELPDGTICMAPQLMDLPDLEGQAVTKAGLVCFAFRFENGKLHVYLKLPDNSTSVFRFPNGKELRLSGGEHEFAED